MVEEFEDPTEQPIPDNMRAELMDNNIEETEAEEPEEQIDYKRQFLFCRKCGSSRLEVLWINHLQNQVDMRCLSCGASAFFKPNLLTEKPKRRYNKKKKLPGYLS